MPRRPRRSASAALAAMAALGVLASCSPNSTPTQTSPPASSAPATTAAATSAAPAAGCAEVAELKSSVEALTKVKPAEDGVPALKTAIADVKTDLESAQGAASEVLQPSVEQVTTAFAELQTAASGLTADNIREKAPAIRTALTGLGTALTELSSTLTQRCTGS